MSPPRTPGGGEWSSARDVTGRVVYDQYPSIFGVTSAGATPAAVYFVDSSNRTRGFVR